MRIRDEDELADPEFSMAPMIDIVFQLLIYFMVATTFKISERELPLDLPTAQSSQLAPETDEIVVDILRDGRTFVAGREVGTAGLVAALGAAAQGSREIPVTVRGDRLASHASVVNVLDACATAGLSNLAVGTIDDGKRN